MKTHSGVYLTLNRRPGVYSHGQPVSMIDAQRGIADQMNDVKFQADGESAMMYVGTERVVVLLKIVGRPIWWLLLMFIPLVGCHHRDPRHD